jgi:hypothetical protein
MPSKYHAKRPGTLPESSEPTIAGIELPRGRLVVPDPDYADGDSTSSPVLWVTDRYVKGVGGLWGVLAAEFHSTGLWPLVLESLSDENERPWLDGELNPGSSSDPADHDAASILAEWWGGAIPDAEEEDEAFAAIAPFGREFPGLAPEPESTGDPNAAEHVARELEGRLGLVAVTRPADVLAVLGWMGPVNYHEDMGMLSAVLRSWEQRFGAYLVGAGFAELTFGVERPPQSIEASTHVAAEHFAACSDNVYQGPGSIEEYASQIAGKRVWGFWWD